MSLFSWLWTRRRTIQKVNLSKRYEFETPLGMGSMSQVFRARDIRSNKIVCVKLLDVEKTRRFEARFPKQLNKPSEGAIAVTLKHPHIVKTYEHGLTLSDQPFLVMEFIEGLSLSHLIQSPNEQFRKRRLQIVIELGEALEYFHRQQWIHRDLCPKNILVDREGSTKLIDFGLVVPNTPPFQAPGNRTGTANYMAPELIKRQRTDQRIDIFSYAVTAYETFTGRLPWDSLATMESAMQHINTPPVDIRDLVPKLDSSVADTLMRGLRVQPGDRWQTIHDMLVPLREASATLAS